MRINHPESFVWWARRNKGNVFRYSCDECRTIIPLKNRVAQSKRKCPGCGEPITIETIDEMLDRIEPERRQIIRNEFTMQIVVAILIVLGGFLLLISKHFI